MAKILVVDDEIKIREIIKEYAEFEGYEVAQAEDCLLYTSDAADE